MNEFAIIDESYYFVDTKDFTVKLSNSILSFDYVFIFTRITIALKTEIFKIFLII